MAHINPLSCILYLYLKFMERNYSFKHELVQGCGRKCLGFGYQSYAMLDLPHSNLLLQDLQVNSDNNNFPECPSSVKRQSVYPFIIM
jgi:hypothetical protein